MRAEGRLRQVVDPRDGVTLRWSQFPRTREEAIEEKVAKYWPIDQSCPLCGHPTIVFYTVSNLPGCCAVRQSLDLHRQALKEGWPTDVSAARSAGLDYYYTPMPFKLCGHPGKTTIQGKCYECEQERKSRPRQLAIASGQVWYQPKPGDLCAQGHNAPRRVSSGSCQECERMAKDARHSDKDKTPTQILMETCPELVISRNEAISSGFKVYRTGKACNNGHIGWRYVSTGACLSCMGR